MFCEIAVAAAGADQLGIACISKSCLRTDTLADCIDRSEQKEQRTNGCNKGGNRNWHVILSP
jgi:hypothetical protein